MIITNSSQSIPEATVCTIPPSPRCGGCLAVSGLNVIVLNYRWHSLPYETQHLPYETQR